jgi:hypothetical protein
MLRPNWKRAKWDKVYMWKMLGLLLAKNSYGSTQWEFTYWVYEYCMDAKES